MTGPSYSEKLSAAEDVLEALREIGETWSCLVGGLAVNLLGVSHKVSDIDILVLRPDRDEASIQDALIALPRYEFWVEAPIRTPGATFMKLFYRIPESRCRIKVDLLLSTSPELEIPNSLVQRHFFYYNNLPVAPLYFVLYHKLLGWEDRAYHRTKWRRLKALEKDSPDIIGLCFVASCQGIMPLSKSHMGRLYLEKFQERADSFVDWYGQDSGAHFRRIGFPV